MYHFICGCPRAKCDWLHRIPKKMFGSIPCRKMDRLVFFDESLYIAAEPMSYFKNMVGLAIPDPLGVVCAVALLLIPNCRDFWK